MTDTSLFYRGTNFEIKHVNTFGVDDSDLAKYMKLLAEDVQEAEETALLQPKHAIVKKEMNKTRVEKLAD